MKQCVAVSLVVAAALGGCVKREMTITSDPPGALVFISDKEIGRTPVIQEFLWYGDYEIALRLKGHQTLHTHREIDAPWYEIVPLDLLSAVAPWTYHDKRYLHFELTERTAVDEADLIRRAEEFRAKAAAPVEQ